MPALLIAFLPFVALEAATISGVVKDADHPTPLPNKIVAAYGATVISTKTDLAGRYTLDVPSGSYHVLAYDNDGAYATGFNEDKPSFEESPVTTVAGGQTATVDLKLHLGGKIEGTVSPSNAHKPVVAAYNVSGTRRGSTTPDATGAYSIVLPPGTYEVVAYDENQVFAPAFFNQKQTFAAADPVTVTAQTTRRNINFFLQIGARLAGAVTDALNNPVASAVVIVYNEEGTQITFAITAADGAFSMTVAPGKYRFVAIDPSFTYAAGFLKSANSYDSSQLITVSGGQGVNTLSFRLERGGQLSGTVVDKVTGAPLRGITVAAYNADGTQRTFVTTDANGRYVLLLPAHPYRVAAFDANLVYATQFYPQANNFAHATAVTTSGGQTATLQPITLSHGGRFSGTVVDQSNGALVSGVVVAAYDQEGNLTANGTSDANGTYRMVVPPGTYRLIAYDPQRRYAPAYAGGVVSFGAIAPVSIATDERKPVPFTMPRGSLVAGTVVDRLHAPVGDIVVSALDLNQNQVAIAISGSDGAFRFALVPGKYKFLASDPNGRYPSAYMGGSTFANAATVTVDARGAQGLTVTVLTAGKRRSVQH
ncbi:MAG TPA: carboxypeptidase-like regulatory domain-containing protein [Thermoanaerobaculia bacterium]|nr:carboxypeptidase-like regulatory domain-containing protein [Thermoanaerobaculia bacterium]